LSKDQKTNKSRKSTVLPRQQVYNWKSGRRVMFSDISITRLNAFNDDYVHRDL